VSGATPLSDGWMKVTAREHRVTAGLRSSLHVFGGYAVKNAATSLAEVETGTPPRKAARSWKTASGRGGRVAGARLVFSVVHIQQGLPVLQDGRPAPDGSAPINNGVLAADDGLVLDWQRDRTPMQPDGVPVFLEPISDELRRSSCGAFSTSPINKASRWPCFGIGRGASRRSGTFPTTPTATTRNWRPPCWR